MGANVAKCRANVANCRANVAKCIDCEQACFLMSCWCAEARRRIRKRRRPVCHLNILSSAALFHKIVHLPNLLFIFYTFSEKFFSISSP